MRGERIRIDRVGDAITIVIIRRDANPRSVCVHCRVAIKLVVIGNAVTIAVGAGGIRADEIDFISIGDAIAIAIRTVRIAASSELIRIGETIAI